MRTARETRALARLLASRHRIELHLARLRGRLHAARRRRAFALAEALVDVVDPALPLERVVALATRVLDERGRTDAVHTEAARGSGIADEPPSTDRVAEPDGRPHAELVAHARRLAALADALAHGPADLDRLDPPALAAAVRAARDAPASPADAPP